MTVDNVLSYVRYNGAEVSVVGDLTNWRGTKTFSINLVAGAELKIAGYESKNCNGCKCSGLMIECDNGLISNLDDWVATGASSQDEYLSSEYTTPCQSTSAFFLQEPSNGALKIWASNGEKYSWFKTIPLTTGKRFIHRTA